MFHLSQLFNAPRLRPVAVIATLLALLAIVAGAAMGIATPAPSAVQAAAAPPVYRFSPAPIAPPGSLGSGRQLTITLAVTDGGRPTGSRTVWLSFRQAAGGGTVAVSDRALTPQPQPFATTEDGTLAIIYTTPTIAPPVQEDVLLAQDAPTDPTATARTWYAFGPQYEFSPPTLAPAGGLAPGAGVRVTLTVRAGGSPRSNETVYLSLRRTQGGGAAQVGTMPLTDAAQAFATDPLGRIAVNYTAPATAPAVGNDYILAQNMPTDPTVEAFAVYGFGPRFEFAPSPVAAAGSLPPGQTVRVTLTTRDASGAPLPGATAYLWISRAAAGGGSAAVAGTPLSDAPQRFTAGSDGQFVVDYTAPGDPASVGRDLIFAQNSGERPGVVAAAWYDFAPQYRFSAAPLAVAGALRPGQTAKVALTVLGQGAPLPEARVYLWIIRGAEGGGAAAQGVPLTGAPQAFIADRGGQIPIEYTAPAVGAAFGSDYVVAQNSAAGAAAGSYTWYGYGLRYDFSASPVAPAGTLTAGHSAQVTLTAWRAGAPLAGAPVHLSLAGGEGGGRAAVGDSPVGSAPRPFLTDENGRISIAYTAPDALPLAGTDSIIAQDKPADPLVAAVTRYGFGPRYVWLPDTLAPAGSLRGGQTVAATLAVRNSDGRPAPGATVLLSLVSVGPGGGAAVGDERLTATPQPFAAGGDGLIYVTYQAPSGTIAGHDYLIAQSQQLNPAAQAYAWYGFGPRYEFSPTPLAPTGSLPAGHSVTATLTAGSGGAPLANAAVYLSMRRGPEGGAASAGGAALTATPQPFLTDASGRIAVTYRAPNANLTGALDEIVAQDAAGNPSVTVAAGYTYGPRYEFAPSPVAAPGALTAGQTVAVALSVSSGGTPLSNAVAHLSFQQAAGGGTAAVEGRPLTAAPQAFTADRDGHIVVLYTAPGTPPSLGADAIMVQSAPERPAVWTSTRYAFGPVLTFAPAPIAAPATLTPGQSVAVTLTATAGGAPLANTPVYFWFAPAPGGGSASAAGVPLSGAPQPVTTDAAGQISLTYTAPPAAPASGNDFILAQERAADPAALAWNWYGFAAP
ncbi:MAG: hypothetical protein NTZ05_04385 [Chloroflexi bacterium]|nr:hypothetical protein [Chloroflexota bacterium]